MSDPTENIRRRAVAQLGSEVESQDEDQERKRLEAIHGQVWETSELSRDFVVVGFMAPFVVVEEKATGKKGTMLFQHSPRLYFGWKEDRK